LIEGELLAVFSSLRLSRAPQRPPSSSFFSVVARVLKISVDLTQRFFTQRFFHLPSPPSEVPRAAWLDQLMMERLIELEKNQPIAKPVPNIFRSTDGAPANAYGRKTHMIIELPFFGSPVLYEAQSYGAPTCHPTPTTGYILISTGSIPHCCVRQAVLHFLRHLTRMFASSLVAQLYIP
jgi:hypothetical protein